MVAFYLNNNVVRNDDNTIVKCNYFSLFLQMSAVGITENVKGDVKKFEIWYSGREVVYIVQVFTFDILDIHIFVFYCSQFQCLDPLTPLFCLGSHSGGESYMADGDS